MIKVKKCGNGRIYRGDRPMQKETGNKHFMYCDKSTQAEIDLCLNCDLPECIETEQISPCICPKAEALRKKINEQRRRERNAESL